MIGFPFSAFSYCTVRGDYDGDYEDGGDGEL